MSTALVLALLGAQLALFLVLLVVAAALGHRLHAVQDELAAERASLANARRAMRTQADSIEAVKSWARTEGRLDAWSASGPAHTLDALPPERPR